MNIPETPEEWVEALFNESRDESDRAVAIVTAAMIDNALLSIFDKILTKPFKKEHSILHGVNAPLNTFSSRIDAAQQLGIISKYFARDLHLIRKIRNEFAHHQFNISFDNPEIQDRIRALVASSDYIERKPEERKIFGPIGPRGDFLCIAAWMLYAIHREFRDQKPFNIRNPEFGYIDWDRLPQELRDRINILDST